MTRTMYVGGIVTVCATILVSAGLLAQDTKPSSPPAEQMQKLMEQAWTEYMTPGEEHAQLAKRAGDWNFHMKMWHYPGVPAEEFDGTSSIKSVMGGRYLFEETEDQSWAGDTYSKKRRANSLARSFKASGLAVSTI